MKAVLAVMVALWPVWGLSQGVVIFSNLGARNAISNGLTGQSVVVGSTFQAALYYAADGIIDETQFFQLGAPANFGPSPGYFSGGGRTAPTARIGGYGMFQVRVWETAYGSTYEQAIANTTSQNGRLALVGKTGIMRVDTANLKDPYASLTALPAAAIGGPDLRDGFTVNVVSEPSTLFLFLAGAVGMLLFRRFR